MTTPVPLRLLLVEDREDDARLVLHELRLAGLAPEWRRVDSRDDFAAALDPSLDLILADYHLPGWDGLEALAALQETGFDIPFILVSGDIGEEKAVEAMRRGAADYFLKDRLGRLGHAVRQQLENRRLRDERRAGDARHEVERQRAEAALRESEDLYRDLVENSRDLICTHDLEGNLLTVNEAAVRLTGIPRAALLEMNMVEFLDPEWRHGFQGYLKEVLESGSATGVMKVRIAGGEVRYWEYDNSLRTGDVAAPVVRGVARDVTESRRAVQALRESEERHRLLFQNSPVPMWVYDLETLRFLAVNEAAQSHYGYSQAEFESMSIRDIRPPQDLARFDEAISLVAGDRGTTQIWRHLKKNGEVIDVEVTADSIAFNERSARLVLAVDVTERIRAERERRHAEDALRRSEKKYRDIVDFAPIGFYQTTPAGRLLMANRTLAEMFGYRSAEGMLGVDVTQLYARPEEREQILAVLKDARVGTGKELCVRRRDGSPFWVEVHERALFDADSEMTGTEGFLASIEERRRSEEALLESEERYRGVVEAAEEIIYTLTPGGLVTSANPAFTRITGWAAEGWIGRSVATLIDAGDHDRMRVAARSVLAGESLPPTDFRLRTADGGLRVVQTTSSPTFKDGRVVQISGVARDVTGERELERERAELTRSLELVLESTDEGLAAIDLHGICTMVNRSACGLLGFTPDELIGRNLHATIHHTRADGRPYPAGECGAYRAIRSALTTRSSEEHYWPKDGAPFPVEMACSPIFENGAVAGGVITFTDITRRRALENQLERANRLSSLGRLTATIAHEFNNVLMGIHPFAEVLARGAGSDPKMLQATTHIVNSLVRGKRITQEILRFTQPAQPALKVVPVESWLRNFETEARSLLHEGIALELRVGPPAFQRMLADASQLQQVLVNLVLNARDAMPRGGRIAISSAIDAEGTVYPFGVIEHPSEFVRITVSDTGVGMSKETMRQIFEPLFTTKPSGTGIGLAVAHQMVQQQGGKIFVESREGAGTSFHLFIPVGAGASDETPAEAPLRKPPGQTRILLVEDDPAVAAGLVAILELEGFEVSAASTGAEGLEAFRRVSPDAVVLDVGLPDMSGVEVYQRMAVARPDLPVVFSTGEGDLGPLRNALDRENVAFMLKPYSVKVLLDQMARLMPDRS